MTELVDALRRNGYPPSWQYQGESQWIMRAGGVDAMTNQRVDLAIRFQFLGASANSGVVGPSVLVADIADGGKYLTPAEVNAVLFVYANGIRNGG